MKKSPKNEIENLRNICERNGFELVETSVGGESFSYYVIPQSMQPNFSDFVIRATGEPEHGYVLGISDSVPEEHRKYAVFHEYTEFMKIGIDTKDRCVQALEKELEQVPDSIKSEYIARRQDFFKNAIRFCYQDKEHYTQQDIKEFGKSLARLYKENK